MEEKLTYIAKKNELTHKKAVYLELKKGPKVFHKDDISIVTEFSKLGEVMQSALLSIELTKLNETPKNVQDMGNAAILKTQQITRNARGGSLKKTKKRYKK